MRAALHHIRSLPGDRFLPEPDSTTTEPPRAWEFCVQLAIPPRDLLVFRRLPPSSCTSEPGVQQPPFPAMRAALCRPFPQSYPTLQGVAERLIFLSLCVLACAYTNLFVSPFISGTISLYVHLGALLSSPSFSGICNWRPGVGRVCPFPTVFIRPFFFSPLKILNSSVFVSLASRRISCQYST
ncbi:uncharacterized protein P884DRAFT_257913 [Thermothelomyces heterothallicus CBS 202.75]|uniref:uncharacterized protein n=1 Tax=Thermothelomyces heterothallicus CBS 202.75 TaxID=1149848 RepID=UPI003742F3BE